MDLVDLNRPGVGFRDPTCSEATTAENPLEKKRLWGSPNDCSNLQQKPLQTLKNRWNPCKRWRR
jgi:hypothetical protein